MQKNIAICIIILVILGIIVTSWVAVSWWKARFSREILVCHHQQPREIEGAGYTTTQLSSVPSRQTEQSVRAKKEQKTAQTETAAEPLMQIRQVEEGRMRVQDIPRSPLAPAPPPHTSTAATAATTTAIPAPATREEQITNEWAQPASQPEQSTPNNTTSEWSSTEANTGGLSEWTDNNTSGGGGEGESSEWDRPQTQTNQGQGEWSGGQNAGWKSPSW